MPRCARARGLRDPVCTRRLNSAPKRTRKLFVKRYHATVLEASTRVRYARLTGMPNYAATTGSIASSQLVEPIAFDVWWRPGNGGDDAHGDDVPRQDRP